LAIILVVFLISTVLSFCAVSFVLKLSHRNKWYDNINERKIHSGDIPRLGGIGFAVAFLFITTGIGIYFGINGKNILHFIPCAIAMFIILISGVIDDFRPMSPLYKMILQFVAAICVIIPGFIFERLLYSGSGFITELGIFSYPITILWMIGITNAFNLLDGIDGLAGGVSAIIVLSLGVIFFSFAGTSRSVLFCTGLFGVLAGFLLLNAPFPKAKIFMGDGGSQFLGFTLALLPLMKEADNPTSLPVFYAAALFVIPIFDTTAAVWRRIRDKKRISDPDKSHIHHKLINLGLGAKRVNAVILSLQIIIGILTFFAIRLEGFLSLLLIGSVYIIALLFFAIVHFMNRAVKLKKTPN
jgi:UDP-GlcNAc:undecaprenyl-phosphate GlcNAc-1-phosphate transferase